MEEVLELQPGRYYYRGGLVLLVTPLANRRGFPRRTWKFRYKSPRTGKPTETTLCSALADTAEEARRKIKVLSADPVQDTRDAKAKFKTFAEVVTEWTDDLKLTGNHLYTANLYLRKHCADLGPLQIGTIDANRIRTVLNPLLERHRPQARRVLATLEVVFNYATSREWFSKPNPASWRLFHKHRWPRQGRGVKPHFPAMPYADVPQFMHELRKLQTYDIVAVVLEFTILTGARSEEVLRMTRGEYDLDRKLWVMQAPRTKQRRRHDVPLSDRAVELLRQLEKEWTGSNYVFSHMNEPLPRGCMRKLLRRMGIKVYTVHGFRSSFADWAVAVGGYDENMVDRCLGHVVGSETTRAYVRADILERRRDIMNRWAAYVGSAPKPRLTCRPSPENAPATTVGA
jgi:integrase